MTATSMATRKLASKGTVCPIPPACCHHAVTAPAAMASRAPQRSFTGKPFRKMPSKSPRRWKRKPSRKASQLFVNECRAKLAPASKPIRLNPSQARCTTCQKLLAMEFIFLSFRACVYVFPSIRQPSASCFLSSSAACSIIPSVDTSVVLPRRPCVEPAASELHQFRLLPFDPHALRTDSHTGFPGQKNHLRFPRRIKGMGSPNR